MSEQQFRLYRYKGAGYSGDDTLGIENSKDPGRVYGLGVAHLGEQMARDRLREFRKDPTNWPSGSVMLFDWRNGVEIPVDEVDYEQKYNDLVVALETAAKVHDLCPQWDEFKRNNNVVVPKPPIPDEPGGYGTVVEFEGYVPASRAGGKGCKWKMAVLNREFTWEELVEFCQNQPFKILYNKG